ncbi:sigma-70 family RNA polymerase sigma factor [uncultured Oxalicibacterium sp.]|uniref:sigma-70 family RNA polymerase sigma factor n=1 Tax=uncultured Oxalicibacterium sp. TaxID=1168540 RepID=UPI0025EDF380|nr:sigma-70 family RNA polymerase sigma factor [uncultured Oxalicibacterium sp.]
MSDDSFDYEAALRACASGDQTALQRLYRQDGKRLLGVALRIVRQRALAEDVVHDAFVSIWRKAGSFDATKGSGRGWIYSVVRHQALNLVRDREYELAVDDDMIDILDAQQEPASHDPYETQVEMGRLHDCLSHLDETKRNSLLFAYVDGCSHREIAERLQSPIGSVKAWIKRGLAALRECMG